MFKNKGIRIPIDRNPYTFKVYMRVWCALFGSDALQRVLIGFVPHLQNSTGAADVRQDRRRFEKRALSTEHRIVKAAALFS